MNLSHTCNSRLTVNGFTINPITKSELLSVVLDGLVSYKETHLCDYGHISTHKNYLGKKIGSPSVIEVNEGSSSFLQGHVDLSNGWLDIRIWNNVYPAEIMLDIYIRGDILDPDLIIDHLCAPALPMDGMGMFDYTYSLSSSPVVQNSMSKFDKKSSAYKVNPEAEIDGDSLRVVLNRLSGMQCHYCDEQATDWIIVGPPMPHDAVELIPAKSVGACKNHLGNGRVTEIRYDIANIPEEDLFVIDSNSIKYEMLDILNEDGSLKYTINKIKEQ